MKGLSTCDFVNIDCLNRIILDWMICMTSGFSLLRILKILLGTYELDHLMRQIVPQKTAVACEHGNPLRLILSLILAWVKFRSAAARAKLRLNSASGVVAFVWSMASR